LADGAMAEQTGLDPNGSGIDDEPRHQGAGPTRARRVLTTVRFGNIGAIYVWIAIIIFFTIEQPSTFPTLNTLRVILNLNAITGLVAISLIVPLSASVYDLSVGYIVAMTSVFAANLIVTHNQSFALTIVLCVAMAVAAGLVNGFLVVVVQIDSFIATLATGALFSAVVVLISNNLNVTDTRLLTDFGKLANNEVFGLTIPVYIMAGVAIMVWWLLEHTVTGRRLYATGFNEEAARLSGVRTKRLKFFSLIVSALVAGLSGVLVTSQIGAGSPDIGPSYLLGSFAAVFLGATQFRNGRFNAQGTVVAVLMLATGTAGLAIIGAPLWAPDLFTGVVLIASLSFYRYEQLRVKRGATKDDPTHEAGLIDDAGEAAVINA
jgi:ribose transport system permease protein